MHFKQEKNHVFLKVYRENELDRRFDGKRGSYEGQQVTNYHVHLRLFTLTGIYVFYVCPNLTYTNSDKCGKYGKSFACSSLSMTGFLQRSLKNTYWY